MKDIVVLLHNMRSAHNVGSLFRTADAMGVSRIFLSGYTPRPVDRFGRVQKDIAKTALGAERFVAWEYAPNPKGFLGRFKKEARIIIGVEQDEHARDISMYKSSDQIAVLFGNEVQGLSKSLRKQCNVLLEIPMKGKKESLNVSVAAGIALHALSSN
ncbi:MAG: hypothetical protein RIQ56_739 [Candidatus Parcubacteria bacterium]|jgi:tRNA G18 (ribose-2'-O)-methylase SpoU